MEGNRRGINPTPAAGMKKEEQDTAKKGKRKKKPEISAPTELRHLSSLSWDRDSGLLKSNVDPEMKSLVDMLGGIEEIPLMSAKYDSIEEQGGMAAVKQEFRTKRSPKLDGVPLPSPNQRSSPLPHTTGSLVESHNGRPAPSPSVTDALPVPTHMQSDVLTSVYEELIPVPQSTATGNADDVGDAGKGSLLSALLEGKALLKKVDQGRAVPSSHSSQWQPQDIATSMQILEMARLMADFKRLYELRGSHDLQSQVKYLAALAEHYYKNGTDNSDWVQLLKAHALYNSVAVRDSEAKEFWSGKAFEVQKTYWGEKVNLSLKAQKRITHYVKRALFEVREAMQAKMDDINIEFECNPDQLKSENNLELYKDFMKHVEAASEFCTTKMVELFCLVVEKAVETAGKPPCEFCVAALGSIARSEATPYSDLEFFFLLDKTSKEIVAYFELLAVTIYFFIGNVQETKLKYMAIEELMGWFEDKSMSGLKIDGLQSHAGNIPTGNGSLEQHNHFICTVNELASKYEDVYNQPNAYESSRGDMTALLSYTVYIFGNKDLLDLFRAKIDQINPNASRQEASKRMLDTDIQKYNFYPDLSMSKPRNLKSDIYRYPTMLLMDLKVLHQLGNSSLKIINEMIDKDIVSPALANNLRFSFCCALYMRLLAYLYHGSQNDSVMLVLRTSTDITVQETTTRNHWFVDPALFIHMMIHLIPLKDTVSIGEFKNVKCLDGISLKCIVALISLCTGDRHTCYDILKKLYCSVELDKSQHLLLASHLSYDPVPVASSTFSKQNLTGAEEVELGNLAELHDILGDIALHHDDCNVAVRDYTKSLEIRRNFLGFADNVSVAASYNNLGKVYDAQGDFKKATTFHKKSLEMRERLFHHSDHPYIAESCSNLGKAYLSQGDLKKAEVYYLKSARIKERIFDDNPIVADSYHKLAGLYERQGRDSEARKWYSRSAVLQRKSNLKFMFEDICNTLQTSHWDGDADENFSVAVTPASSEFDEVENNFRTTPGNCRDAEILEIRRVQKLTLYTQYALQRRFVAKKLQRAEHQVEKTHLWYGASEDAAKRVVRSGFDRHISSNIEMPFWEGLLLFTCDPSLSVEHALPNTSSECLMFQCRVIVGEYTTAPTDKRNSPQNAAGDLCDSMVDNLANPSIFAIFTDVAAYPEYVIKFKLC